MTTTTLSVETTTRDRFNARKGKYQAEQGHQIEADEFVNHLLDAYDAADKIVENLPQNEGE